ncbi:BON domain-containing protein [Hymenobacter siberiensis]|uniref:BON domain-containing protein n=1 Tax=Hymenobacter siberiensis TaxID=2848396 RepID=UPI001C1DD9E2|nr:BON domain-containing protein [Hymenobacter siberiensis]MBU6123367.1 BON domain-containing protein [Hymenobacter siberiensis]
MQARNQPLLDALHLLGAYRAPGSELRGDNFAPRPDEAIVHKVREALLGNPRGHGSETLVQAHRGIVTLMGTVSSRRAHQEAEHGACQVAGVHTVHNLLKIRPAYMAPDSGIHQSTLAAGAHARNTCLRVPAPVEPAAYEPQATATLKFSVDARR